MAAIAVSFVVGYISGILFGNDAATFVIQKPTTNSLAHVKRTIESECLLLYANDTDKEFYGIGYRKSTFAPVYLSAYYVTSCLVVSVRSSNATKEYFASLFTSINTNK